MNKCNDALVKEYPKMTMFGETWVHEFLHKHILQKIMFKLHLKVI
jgi:hypothetical protein